MAADSVAALVRRSFATFGERRAILDGAEWVTFAELKRRVDERAEQLLRLARPGDRVVIATTTTPQSRIDELAVLSCGLVRVAVSPRLHPREIAGIARDCGARILITDAATEALEGGPPASPDVAMLIYTSGSTGNAKGAIVTHRAWLRHGENALAHLPAIDENDVVLAAAQLPHFGGSIALDCATGGAATVFLPRFDASEVLDTVEAHGVTILPLATTMLAQLVAHLERSGGAMPPSVRAVVYGGSGAPLGLLERAARLMPGLLTQFYGLAEALAPLTWLSPDDHDAAVAENASADARARLRSAGRWIPGVAHRFAPGPPPTELSVRAEIVMPGYWNGATVASDGWLATGDLAHEADGYLYVAERTGNVIVSGGFVVHPREVEDVIAGMPDVDEVAVVGMPHERWGQGITAVVVPHHPPADPDEFYDLVVAHCREHLASYKKPLAVYLVDALPRSAAGKIDRRAIIAHLETLTKAER